MWIAKVEGTVRGHVRVLKETRHWFKFAAVTSNKEALNSYHGSDYLRGLSLTATVKKE